MQNYEGDCKPSVTPQMNGDEADKLHIIIQAALQSNDNEKALRISEMARRMCPEDARLTVAILQHREAPERRRQPPTSSSAALPSREYTAEDQQVVETILQSNDDRVILGIERGVMLDSNTVRQCMRKMVLRVHPDKNNAPGSLQAFQKLQISMREFQKPPPPRPNEEEPGSSSRYVPPPPPRPNVYPAPPPGPPPMHVDTPTAYASASASARGGTASASASAPGGSASASASAHAPPPPSYTAAYASAHAPPPPSYTAYYMGQPEAHMITTKPDPNGHPRPFCIVCNRFATDDHMTSKMHLRRRLW